MFDLGFSELLVVGTVALIVVGPKDLPVMFRNVGRFVGKAKGMAREFSRAMNDAADETGVRDIAKGLKTATNPMSAALDGVKDAARDLTADLNPAKFGSAKYDPTSETGKLSAERAADVKKIQAATARKAADRMARDAKAALAKADEAEAALVVDTPDKAKT